MDDRCEDRAQLVPVNAAERNPVYEQRPPVKCGQGVHCHDARKAKLAISDGALLPSDHEDNAASAQLRAGAPPRAPLSPVRRAGGEGSRELTMVPCTPCAARAGRGRVQQGGPGAARTVPGGGGGGGGGGVCAAAGLAGWTDGDAACARGLPDAVAHTALVTLTEAVWCVRAQQFEDVLLSSGHERGILDVSAPSTALPDVATSVLPLG